MAILCGLLSINTALAYIDPGTTGMLVGNAIWPFIVAIFAAIGGVFLKIFYHPIKNKFSKFKK